MTFPNIQARQNIQEGMAITNTMSGKQAVCMICHFYETTEPKTQVKDWYANSLRMYGWNITFQSQQS